MQKPHCFIVTVGTSLITPKHLLDVSQRCISEYQSEHDSDYKNGKKETPYAIREMPCQSVIHQKITTEAGYIVSKGVNSVHGAELCALFSGKSNPFTHKDDAVVLFGTRTKKGAYCAEALRKILLNIAKGKHASNPTEQVRLEFPVYLGLPQDPDFAAKGLGALVDLCYTIIIEYKETHDVRTCSQRRLQGSHSLHDGHRDIEKFGSALRL